MAIHTYRHICTYGAKETEGELNKNKDFLKYIASI